MFLLRWLTAPVRWVLKVVILLVVGLVVYYAVTLVKVWLTSREYVPVRAQAIVVMGATQTNGAPLADLRARLNQALVLYQQGYARLIVCTGSTGAGGATEAAAGKAYLESKKVPSADILEASGPDSWTALVLAAGKLKPHGDTSVLVVTDPFGEDRAMAIASAVGLTPHPAPTQSSPINGTAVIPYFLRTAVAVALGRIVGFQRLHWLGTLPTAAHRLGMRPAPGLG